MEIYNNIAKIAGNETYNQKVKQDKEHKPLKKEDSAKSEETFELSNTAKVVKEGNRVLTEMVGQVRTDKISQARAKIESGYYNKPDVLNDIAEKLLGI